MLRSRRLTDAEIAILEKRARALGLSPRRLLERFGEALKRDGIAPAPGSIKTRLDRVLNPRMRCPTSEETFLALAAALEWSRVELDTALEGAAATAAER